MPALLPSQRRDLTNEDGWVMVPVIALLAIAIGLAFALLALVDQQTSASRQQRVVDAAQTLAEGVVTATTSVLGSDPSPSTWPTTGPCITVTGDLSNASTAPATSLPARITAEVQRRFDADSNDYTTAGGRSSTWTVDVCPALGTVVSGASPARWDTSGETRWQDSFLNRTITSQPTAAPPPQTSMWVRGQADVQATSTSGKLRNNSRAVAVKVRQDGTSFTAPTSYALGTGQLSTDLGSTLSTAVRNGVVGKVLGSDPLIADSSARIGIRCGLLNTLNNPNTTCLGGTLAGVTGATNALGLGALNGLLGTSQTTALGGYTLTDSRVIDAYRRSAQATGIYKESVVGTGRTTTHSYSSSSPPPDCITNATNSSTVVFIEQVGDGDNYCTLSGTRVAKIFIVARGGVRVTGSFTGVLYAPNLEECGSDAVCTATERKTAVPREVVRIEGNGGKVTGAVWVDGAGGSAGIYPTLANPSARNLLAIGGSQNGLCELPLVGPVLTGVSNLLSGIVVGLGTLVTELLSSYQFEQNPTPESASSCAFLRSSLGNLTTTQLLDLFGKGGTQTLGAVVTTRRQCRINLLIGTAPSAIVAGLCVGYWTAPVQVDSRPITATFTDPATLTQFLALPGALNDVVGLLTGTLSNYTAIKRDVSVITNSGILLGSGAGPINGTYRNVPVTAPGT